MAYNPFDFFRRNQKLFFGGLTILVMFMFILSFGQGDFFSQASQWIGQWQTHGDTLAVIDGSTIKKSQVDDVSSTRGLANGYMLNVASRSLLAARNTAEAEAIGATPDLAQQLSGAVRGIEQRLQTRLTGDDLAAARQDMALMAGRLNEMAKNPPRKEDKAKLEAVQKFAEAALGELARRASGDRGEGGIYFANQPNRTDRDRLEFLLWKKKADKLGIRYTREDVERLVAAEFPAQTAADLKKLADEASAGHGKKTTTELFDALADEFRVRAAQTAVMGVGAVRDPSGRVPGSTHERYQQYVKDTTVTKYTFLTIPIEAYLPQVKGEPTEAELTKILNDFANSDPDPSSPRPGLREPRRVGVQWVEVTGDEPFYKDLAEKRRTSSPQFLGLIGGPAGLNPTIKGFTYEDYVQEQQAIAANRQKGSSNTGRPPLSFEGGMKVDGMRALAGVSLGEAYSDALLAQGGVRDIGPPMPAAGDKLLDVEVVQPDLIAAFAGLTASSLATNGTPFATPTVAVTEAAYRRSREQRVLAGVRGFFAPTLEGPVALIDAVGASAAMTAAPAPLPPAVVQPVLDRRTTDQLRTVVATEDVQAFKKKLTEIMTTKADIPKGTTREAEDKLKREQQAKNTKDAEGYVAEWIKARGLKTGATAEPRNVLALADDPGLAHLLAKDKGLLTAGKPKNVRAQMAFGQTFVQDDPIPMMLKLQLGGRLPSQIKSATGAYQVRVFDPTFRFSERDNFGLEVSDGMFGDSLRVSGGTPLTLVWRTVEVDAQRPLTLSANNGAVREECRRIWKLGKARDLARKAADTAAQTIQKAKGANAGLVNQYANDARAALAAPFGGDAATATKFQVYADAPEFSAASLPLVPPPPGGFGGAPTVGQFNPLHPAITYETEKMREELLAHKDDSIGSTFVFYDQPQTTLYLTVVSGRDEGSAQKEFEFRFYVLYPLAAMPPGDGYLPLGPDMMAPRFSRSAGEADRKTAVSLLKAEFGYSEPDPSKLSDERE